MILYVLRHGIAEDPVTGDDDRGRRLTPRGRARMRAAATGMLRLDIRPELILTSPLVRARQTAEIVAAAQGSSPQELAALATGVPATETVRALRAFARHASVMVVGHEPQLGQLVSLLLTGSTEGLAVVLKKGGLVALEVERMAPHGAELRAMLTPRQLRRLG